MSAAFQVMQNLYENRKTGEKAVMVSGEFQKMLDGILKKHPEYKDYSGLMGVLVQKGLAELTKE